jgi:2-polyprenyl-3-methyl-5-hydroxy-6-metoxy-1,4-benzoquinol methylase
MRKTPVQDNSQLTACLVCGGVYEPSSLPGLFRCSSCGFVSANLAIPDEALKALYNRDYFQGSEYQNYLADEEALKLNFDRRISTLRQIIPGFDRCSLYEIGCAYGFFLELASHHVGAAVGIDISEDAARYARECRGLSAESGDYLTATLPRPVDVIAMWDTVEHLKRPDLFVAKAARDLKPGGFLALTTGDIGSLNARLRGRRWRMIHPPTHLHYFSKQTNSRLLQRFGFEVVHLSHPGFTRNVRYILYILMVLRWKRESLFKRIERLPALDLPLTINLYDIMFVVARSKRI